MSDPARDFAPLIERLDALFDRLEAVLPTPLPATDWTASAFRWRTRGGRGWLEAVKQPHRIRFEDLQGVEDQKQRIAQNTKQFVQGRSANNVLLTGARGTGKSSLVKAVLNRFAAKGLRLIEVDKDELVHLPEIVDLIATRRERFIIFLRRPFLRVGRARLQGDEEHPRRLDHRHAGQPAGVCDLEPPPPDAGKDVGEPRGQA
jgi:predicted AAA+ superfamily ATPase